MKPIGSEEILPFEEWERVRTRLRPLFIHEKEHRRLAVSDYLTLLFENGQTVWYQIQEMVRAEKITDRDAIRHEVETYNELIPGAGELSATMLIEFTEPKERDAALRRLVGLERHVWLRLGDRRVSAQFDRRQMSTEQISSVQFIRFPLGNVTRTTFLKLADAGQVMAEVDHPSLTAQAVISGPLAAALAEDLPDGEHHA
jgi:uncharacterized protein DUF3501